ncbi:Protein HLJ1 [Diplonema papillatum]|nr:Protein HLJ1 [Diplonema papillatum]|eukprot:gene16862-25856_t
MSAPTTWTDDDLAAKSVKQLRQVLSDLGVGSSDCLDKNDLRQKVRRVLADPSKYAANEASASEAESPGPGTPVQPTASKAKARETATVEITRILRTKDFYEILRLTRTAETAEINKAYKKLALKLHPDKCQEPRAEEAFKQVSRAYDTLTNRREQYDQFGDESDRLQPAGRGPADFNPEDIFREVFGGGAFGPGMQFHSGRGGRGAQAFHFSFGPGGFQQFGQQQPRRGAQQQPRQGQAQQYQQPTAMLLVFFLVMLLPMLLPLISALLPFLVVFMLMNSLR